MSAASSAVPRRSPSSPLSPAVPRGRRIAVVRAAVALVWAGALAVAVGDDVPTTSSSLPALVAVLLTGYPLVDAVSSALEAAVTGARDALVLRANAGLSALAAVALGVASFGGDAGATLATFGAWAFASGAVQLGVALRRRRSRGRQLPMVVSGGLSALAGLSFAAAASQEDAHLAALAGYAAVGAVLYLVWAARARH